MVEVDPAARLARRGLRRSLVRRVEFARVKDGPDRKADTPDDFHLFLHELRTRELERLPPGAKVVLSGGAADSWYFDWFESHYPTVVDRHIGVEALAPKPDGLPEHVEWLSMSLGDLSPVASRSVDLVFAGEVIEHLWPDDISGFLTSAHRVLRAGGRIALDSPNRRVTQAIDWLHPEHTVEFSVDEIVELLELAGFEDVHVRGVLLTYDTERHEYLPLHDLDTPPGRQERVDRAAARPEDSLVWWAEATRGERTPDPEALRRRVRELFARFRRNRLGQTLSWAGEVADIPHLGRVIRAVPGEKGPMLFGPYMAMPAGSWEVVFELRLPNAGEHQPGGRVASLDVVHGSPPVTLARVDLTANDLAESSAWSRHAVRFDLDTTTMGVEFRVLSEGQVELWARVPVDLRPTAMPTLPQRRPRGRTKNWLRRHPRLKAVAKRVDALLPGTR
jgi:SAM-dependent methyltransferase